MTAFFINQGNSYKDKSDLGIPGLVFMRTGLYLYITTTFILAINITQNTTQNTRIDDNIAHKM